LTSIITNNEEDLDFLFGKAWKESAVYGVHKGYAGAGWKSERENNICFAAATAELTS
jgi:hypothetical protein